MSIRKVKLASGEMKWEVRVYENGRGSSRITRRFDRKNDADGFLQNFKQEQRSRLTTTDNGLSIRERQFKDEAEYWLIDRKLRSTESHLLRVEGILKEVLPIYGDLSVAQFTPELLGRYQQKEKLRGMANATINRKTEVISAILNFATRQRRIPYNPAAGFRKLPSDSVETAFWSREEAESFLVAMNKRHAVGQADRWIYVAYQLALNTGLRAGEIWGLKSKDLIPEKSTLLIQRQWNRVAKKLTPTKGKKSRFVPAGVDLMKELQTLITKGKLQGDDLLFTNQEGEPVCHDNFNARTLKADLKYWGGRKIRFHDFRHTAITLMVAAGIDLKTVKEISGHADVHTTMNYSHLVVGIIGSVADRFSVQPKDPNLAADERLLKLV